MITRDWVISSINKMPMWKLNYNYKQLIFRAYYLVSNDYRIKMLSVSLQFNLLFIVVRPQGGLEYVD